MKTCPHCKETKPLSEFYSRRGKEGSSSYCKICTNAQTIYRQQKCKQDFIRYKGSECQCCGYNKYQGALEFHHLDPNEKDFTIAHVKNYNLTEEIKAELDKCILVCANCHREIHAGLIAIDGSALKTTKELNWNVKRIKVEKVKIKKQSTKIIWPSKESLLKLLWEKPTSTIAKDLGVSDSAIAKHCKLRGIDKPPVGYWSKQK